MRTHGLIGAATAMAALCAPLPIVAELSGESAPDFALTQLSGTRVQLSALRGDVVMVNFWATWCAPCRQEMPLLDEIYRRYQPLGFELLGVNVDEDIGHAADVVHTLGVSYPVLLDDAKAVSRLYEIDAMPMSVLIDRDGTVRYLHRGYRRGDEQAYLDHIRELLKD